MPNQYKKITLEDCIKVAQSKNGRCLSTEYINANIPLIWECEFGHTFQVAWKHIQYYKSWCHACNTNTGEEICRVYLETIFGAKFSKIKPDWLKYINGRNLELDGYCSELKLAFEHNGLQHYQTHIIFHENENNLKTQISRDQFKKQRCEELGIKLLIIPEIFASLKLKDLRDYIIDECNKLGIALPLNTCDITMDLSKVGMKNNKLEYYDALAISKGGRCISKTYIRYHEPLLWQCKEGHTWQAVGFSIENGTWCPICAGTKKLSIKDAQLVASIKGGFCLSIEYISANEKLEWQCEEGHIWLASFESVRQATWCPFCRKGKQKVMDRAL